MSNSSAPIQPSPQTAEAAEPSSSSGVELRREKALELLDLMKNEEAVKGHLERLRRTARDIEAQTETAQRSLALFSGQLGMAGSLLVGSESRELLLRHPMMVDLVAELCRITAGEPVEGDMLWEETQQKDMEAESAASDLSMDWPEVMGEGWPEQMDEGSAGLLFEEEVLDLEEPEPESEPEVVEDAGGELLDGMLDTFVDETGDAVERAAREEMEGVV